MKHCKLLTCLCITFLLFQGCNSEKKDWNQSKITNSIEGYKAFMDKHPESQFLDSAKYFVQFIEKKIRFDKILAMGNVDSIKGFIYAKTNNDLLEVYKYSVGDTLKLMNQPDSAKSGYKLSLKSSKEKGKLDYYVTIPPKTLVNLDIKEDVNVKIIKGDLLVTIVNGSSTFGYKTGEKEATLLISLEETSKIILSEEFIDIQPQMFVKIDSTEYIFTLSDSVSVKRELITPEYLINSGTLYHIKK